MDLLGRRQPSLWRISLTQVANATTAEVVGPSTRVVQNGRRGGAVGEKSDAGWFYELQLNPTFRNASARDVRASNTMDAPCKTCAGVTQSDLCGILLCTLLTRGLYSPLGAAGRRSLHDPVPVLRIAPNLSLEVFALLQRNYECWLISILSAINWIGLGRIFEDSRAAVCVVLWLSSQIVVSVDANYRTDPSTVRSTILLGPLLIMVVACCAYRLIPDSSSPKLPIGILTMESRQTVIFTSSTLVIFLVKKAYLRVYRQRVQARNQVDLESSGDRHVISCVVLHARMHLVPVISKQRLRLGTVVRNQAATASCAQQLRLAHHGSIILDVCRKSSSNFSYRLGLRFCCT
ncbi:hypothetical protein PHYSODRAFT_304247 [Phytophthora sojae]|uniref:Uncharacterized protein n=1 Tax=Phytophthora sojae (strain P6497) TaxID=1094619 RepID=G4ZY85_PHYSP|nr:hypothetical protein PHYSODRAFT_304247 [Phytophthora sojae]EGZ12697.1 hypothetical protein PHYSODRAFT_304247 [Phytophthora sojae]|eukprot:XP_009533030.1 hypothetical protein PHYSODRAFT_304247 [Phytophthora sojae]